MLRSLANDQSATIDFSLEGAAVRDYAMSRQSCRTTSEVFDDNDVENCPKKSQTVSYGEAQHHVGNAIHALERGEDQRVKLLKESAQRENKQIEIEERRLEVDKETRSGDR